MKKDFINLKLHFFNNCFDDEFSNRKWTMVIDHIPVCHCSAWSTSFDCVHGDSLAVINKVAGLQLELRFPH